MEKSEKPLNERQERFCMLVAVPDREGKTMARADAYLASYDRCKSRRYASIHASKLMKDPRVRARIERLTTTLYDDYVEKELPFTRIVARLRDRIDDDRLPSTQLRAIKLALDMRAKYVENHVPQNEHEKRFAKMTDEELRDEMRKQGFYWSGTPTRER